MQADTKPVDAPRNLGRARRSKKHRNTPARKAYRNPLLDHTIDDDLPDIRKYAEKYKELDEPIRKSLDLYIFNGKNLDYYYGSYVATYQMFVMAHLSDNDIAPSLMWMLHAISYRIVQTIGDAKKEFTDQST